jgi:hypothetical protein
MNGFQFTASLVGSLVWPIVVVVIVVVLRKPLSQIFSSLTLNKLSYKDWQFDFGEKIAKLTSTADKANIPDVISETTNWDGDQPVTRTDTSKQENQMEELTQLESQIESKVQDLEMKLKELEERLAVEDKEPSQQEDTKKRETELRIELEKEKLEIEKKNLEFQKLLAQLVLKKGSGSKDDEIRFLAVIAPTEAVLVAWSQLEQEIISTTRRLVTRRLVSELSISYYSNRFPIKESIELLLRYGYIDRQTATILNDMKNLRNKAAHRSITIEEISSTEALEYIQLAQRMIQLLSSPQSPSNDVPPFIQQQSDKLKYEHFNRGDKVRHIRFGEGIVLKSEIEGKTEFVEVQFQGIQGKKRLSMDLSKLEKI